MRLSLMIFIWSTFAFMAKSAESQATCGLLDIEEGSPDDRYTLPPVSDYLVNRTLLWQTPLFGQVDRTSASDNPDFQYIDATHTASYYRLYSNTRTRYFPRDMNKREITRDITIHCVDGTSSRYFLKVPLHDMTPPEFQQPFYSMNITTDWGSERPISEDQLIIVGDNDYQLGLEDLGKNLRFQTTVDVLNIVPHKLWTENETTPEIFYYRLDLYFKEGISLAPGTLQLDLSASDDVNTESTVIEIIVNPTKI